jgi:hypothetical protein
MEGRERAKTKRILLPHESRRREISSREQRQESKAVEPSYS